MKILKSGEIQNSLLDRREVKVRVESDVSPSRIESVKIVSEQFSCELDCVNIVRISSNFGTRTFTIVADIYKSKQARDVIAIKKKKNIEMEKKAEEEGKLEEKTTGTKEETKEEKPEEIKETDNQEVEQKIEESSGQEEKTE